mmetsp:Transcript_61889/g.163883  ORF Transcript_61889/g.163883 Transcript_61889/m.163883 type:complete len:200 (-) Transcript_61889:1015-1614(-)
MLTCCYNECCASGCAGTLFIRPAAIGHIAYGKLSKKVMVTRRRLCPSRGSCVWTPCPCMHVCSILQHGTRRNVHASKSSPFSAPYMESRECALILVTSVEPRVDIVLRGRSEDAADSAAAFLLPDTAAITFSKTLAGTRVVPSFWRVLPAGQHSYATFELNTTSAATTPFLERSKFSPSWSIFIGIRRFGYSLSILVCQ